MFAAERSEGRVSDSSHGCEDNGGIQDDFIVRKLPITNGQAKWSNLGNHELGPEEAWCEPGLHLINADALLRHGVAIANCDGIVIE